MSPTIADTMWVAINIVCTVLALACLIFGLRLAATRRTPRLLLPLGVPQQVSPPPQFVRHGGSLALSGIGMLLLQASILSANRTLGLALAGRRSWPCWSAQGGSS
jgi:hypothetical protein